MQSGAFLDFENHVEQSLGIDEAMLDEVGVGVELGGTATVLAQALGQGSCSKGNAGLPTASSVVWHDDVSSGDVSSGMSHGSCCTVGCLQESAQAAMIGLAAAVEGPVVDAADSRRHGVGGQGIGGRHPAIRRPCGAEPPTKPTMPRARPSGPSGQAMAAALAPAARCSTASTSCSSTRWPAIFTCRSSRPRNTSPCSGVRRARSPVRYQMRSAISQPKRTKRCNVRSWTAPVAVGDLAAGEAQFAFLVDPRAVSGGHRRAARPDSASGRRSA